LRTVKISSIVAAMILVAACRGHRETVTGDYGMGVVSGQIVMASGMANASPVGVRVAVGGTGMSAVVGADGRFAFAGVQDGAELIFQRQSDGVNARLSLASTSAPVVVELSQTTATLSRHRAVPSVPMLQIEGLITATGATSLTVHDSHNNDDVLQITDKTVIRKGHTLLTPADLTVGWRVHVAATEANGTKTAVLIIVQDEKSEPGDDNGGDTMTANGTVKAVGADNLTVTTVPKGDVTVKVDANTIIRKQGAIIHLADIKVGDQVNTMGKRIDDHTLLARQIEVRGVGQEHPEEAEAEGTVKSVGTSSLVVTTSHGDVTVNVDSSTSIRKQGKTIQLSDVKVGDEVSAEGQKVDATTMLAKKIEVHPNGDGGSHH
jgi:Cu/Ag efflux protein CusF